MSLERTESVNTTKLDKVALLITDPPQAKFTPFQNPPHSQPLTLYHCNLSTNYAILNFYLNLYITSCGKVECVIYYFSVKIQIKKTMEKQFHGNLALSFVNISLSQDVPPMGQLERVRQY